MHEMNMNHDCHTGSNSHKKRNTCVSVNQLERFGLSQKHILPIKSLELDFDIAGWYKRVPSCRGGTLLRVDWRRPALSGHPTGGPCVVSLLQLASFFQLP